MTSSVAATSPCYSGTHGKSKTKPYAIMDINIRTVSLLTKYTNSPYIYVHSGAWCSVACKSAEEQTTPAVAVAAAAIGVVGTGMLHARSKAYARVSTHVQQQLAHQVTAFCTTACIIQLQKTARLASTWYTEVAGHIKTSIIMVCY